MNPSESKWLDRFWLVLVLVYGLFLLKVYDAPELCTFAGVDFRGYYTSAQIALQHGFTEVYDPQLQAEYQARLPNRCSGFDLPSSPPFVLMPYLPMFILIFIPLTYLDFTLSFYLWTALNLIILGWYFYHFSNRLGKRIPFLRFFQWIICIPVIYNLFLGQMNVFLVICLGEFLWLFLNRRHIHAGLWLGGMLLKPHTLLLLLPGLIISRNWSVLLGFSGSLLVILGGSWLMVGVGGLGSITDLVSEFADPSFYAAPGMMNWRALAMNLDRVTPTWFAWAIAAIGITVVVITVLYEWRFNYKGTPNQLNLLLLLTYAGTCVIAWHSLSYLWMPMIPILIFLDTRRMLPLSLLSFWLCGPPVVFLVSSLVEPDLRRNLLGFCLLLINLIILLWASIMLNMGESLTTQDRHINDISAP